MQKIKNKMAQDFLSYTLGTYVVQVLGIIISLSMRYFLDPPLMGVWSLLDMTMSYGLYANLGVSTAVYAEVPAYIGRGEIQKARDLRDTGFTFMLCSSTLAALGFVVWAFTVGKLYSPELRWGMVSIAFILVVTSVYNFYSALMWAEKRFSLLSKAIVLNSAAYLILIFILVSRFKLAGLLGAVFASVAASLLFLEWGSKPGLRFLFRKDLMLELLRAGLPLIAVGFCYSTFMSLDRMMIAKFLGLTLLGSYSIALLVMTYANAIPKLLAVVIFPSMQENFGATGNADIGGYIKKPALLLSFCMPLMLGGAFFTAPFLVRLILPKYLEGLDAMQIFLLGSFFLSVSQPVQNYLTSTKRLHHLPIIFAGAATATVTNFILIAKGFGLSGVAAGMSLGFFIYYSVLVVYVLRHFSTARETAFFYLETLACFLYFVMSALLVKSAVHAGHAVVEWLAQCIVFTLLMLPLLLQADRKTGAFKTLWSAINHRINPKAAH